MMVAAISATPNPKTSSRGGGGGGGGGNNQSNNHQARPPLLPSEGDNVVVPPRRPKSREVTSRYMSSSTSISAHPTPSSRRCPSPLVSRTASTAAAGQMTPMPTPSLIKRSQSVERRRPATPRPGTPGNAGGGEVTSTAAKMLFTSTRSLSVSFQGESFSLKVSKAKPAPTPIATPGVRKGTPERRRATPLRGGGRGDGGGTDQVENSKLIDHQRWPARLRQANSLSRSMDCTDERKRLGGSGNVVRALQSSMIDERIRTSTDGRLQSDSGNVELRKAVEHVIDTNSATGSAVPSDSAASDAESVSSGSTSGAQEFGGAVPGRGGQRGIMVPARFWQETNNRLRQGRSSEPSSPQSKSMGLKTTATPKLNVPKKVNDTPVLSPRSVATSRGLSSPLRGSVRPASPSKFSTSSAASSPLRGTSPSRMRNGVAGTFGSNLSNVPSILSFACDVRRGKMGENRIDEAHFLRLLYNRLLQWRYVNAKADAANSAQTMTAEKSLFNAWMTISKLRDSVRDKRIMIQMLRQNLKLTSILKEQMVYLEDWALMDRDHSSSLSGAVEAFKASTLRLPIVGGARAEVQNVKDAVCSAVDVMQAMASSICSLLSKVDGMNSLVSELANIASKERALLNQCKDLLSTIAAMQVKDCSLRTHILQLNRIPSSLTTEL